MVYGVRAPNRYHLRVPELPEVETVARMIRPGLVGRRVNRVEVSWTRTLGGVSVRHFRDKLVGARFERVRRRGKYIVMELADGRGCIVGHLRMTGRMQVDAPTDEANRFTKVSLTLDNDTVFRFIDVRKFGRFVWAPTANEVIPPLGPEPLSGEFTAEWFRNALRSRRRALKPLLLDQGFVAGIGNIYCDEALHAARLHPLRKSDTVRRPAADRLHAAIRAILEEAIEREGSSFDGFYRTPEGQPGAYQDQFHVYGRTGKPCPRCERAIRRIVVGQRGTHLCPTCQRAPRAGKASNTQRRP